MPRNDDHNYIICLRVPEHGKENRLTGSHSTHENGNDIYSASAGSFGPMTPVQIWPGGMKETKVLLE